MQYNDNLFMTRRWLWILDMLSDTLQITKQNFNIQEVL